MATLFIELQCRHAWRATWEFIRAQWGGVLVALLTSAVAVPIVVSQAHAKLGDQLVTTLATYVIGPTVVFILAYLYFFLLAPGRLHAEAHLQSTVSKPVPVAFTATALVLLVGGLVILTIGAWFAAHAPLAGLKQALQLEQRAFGDERRASHYWRDRTTTLGAKSPERTSASTPRLSFNSARETAGATVAKPVPSLVIQQAPAPSRNTPPPPPLVLPAPNPRPTSLTTDQQRFLIASLARLRDKVDHTVVFWVGNDGGSLSLANEFQAVMQRAGLKPNLGLMNPNGPEETGVMLVTEADTAPALIAEVKDIFLQAGIVTTVVTRPTFQTHALMIFVGPTPL
jgi:hypothetical protein